MSEISRLRTWHHAAVSYASMVMNGHSILQHIAVTVNIPVGRWDLRIKIIKKSKRVHE